MPVAQCPYCDLMWSPRKVSPRWCPRCKRWIKGVLKEVTDTDAWFTSRQRPVWKGKGELIISETPITCTFCGIPHLRVIELKDSNMRLCGECIYRLLSEDTQEDPWRIQ